MEPSQQQEARDDGLEISAIPSGFLAQFSDNFAVPESVRLIKCHPPEPSTVRSWVLHGETDAAEYIITTGLPD
jgi:hypothetical protein